MKFHLFLQTHLDNKEQESLNNIYKEKLPNYIDNITVYDVNKKRILTNIDNFNKYFSEYCMMYYLWKNKLYLNYDIISISHYRRFLNIQNLDINKYLNINGVLLGVPREHYNNVLTYNNTLLIDDTKYKHINAILNNCKMPLSIIQLFNKYLDLYYNNISYEKLNNEFQYNIHWFNIFICSNKEFDNLMHFLNGFILMLFDIYKLTYNSNKDDFNNFIENTGLYNFYNVYDDFSIIYTRSLGAIIELLTSFYFKNVSKYNIDEIGYENLIYL